MAGTCWKSSFGIPEYSAEIHLKRLKWKEPSQGAYPLRILMEWKSNCLTLPLDSLQRRSRLPSCCCMLLSFGCSAASLRPPARLLFQPFRCDDWIYFPIDPAFMLLRESHARGRIQHESDWCSSSAVLNGEPDWSTTLVSWRCVESNKGIGGSAREISSFAFCCAPAGRCDVLVYALFMVCKKDLDPSPLGLLVKIRQAFPLWSMNVQSVKKVISWCVHAWRAWGHVEFPAWRNASDCVKWRLRCKHESGAQKVAPKSVYILLPISIQGLVSETLCWSA